MTKNIVLSILAASCVLLGCKKDLDTKKNRDQIKNPD
jgi:hypothetical protein